jgi:segregation and condensation protein A
MIVNTLRQTHFSLENFRGPLEFLAQLVQRHELDIRDIPLQALATQFLTSENSADINAGAEFISTLASLALMKSRLLLPQQPQDVPTSDEETEAGVALLQNLIDYCRLKEVAKGFALREEQHRETFPRGAAEECVTLPSTLGIEQITWEDLRALLTRAIKQADPLPAAIAHEVYRVSDKIRWIKQELATQIMLAVATLFPLGRPRRELVVIFLAILELMKMGIAALDREENHGQLVLIAQH